MYKNNGYSTYKQNSVNSASKEQLLLMLVDGAVKFAKRGKLAIEEKKVADAHHNLVRVQDIFSELMATLDRTAGKWAEDLFELYKFINKTVAEANLKKDLKVLNDAIGLIEEVRDMWHEAYRLAHR
ncbi:MAG: flagellar export chaperone FliS [Sarcina sp.]